MLLTSKFLKKFFLFFSKMYNSSGFSLFANGISCLTLYMFFLVSFFLVALYLDYYYFSIMMNMLFGCSCLKGLVISFKCCTTCCLLLLIQKNVSALKTTSLYFLLISTFIPTLENYKKTRKKKRNEMLTYKKF